MDWHGNGDRRCDPHGDDEFRRGESGGESGGASKAPLTNEQRLQLTLRLAELAGKQARGEPPAALLELLRQTPEEILNDPEVRIALRLDELEAEEPSWEESLAYADMLLGPASDPDDYPKLEDDEEGEQGGEDEHPRADVAPGLVTESTKAMVQADYSEEDDASTTKDQPTTEDRERLQTPETKLSDYFENGKVPKASELKKWAEQQGWTKSETPYGPPKYIDEMGIVRLTIKMGSHRTVGSENPHVEIRDAEGYRRTRSATASRAAAAQTIHRSNGTQTSVELLYDTEPLESVSRGQLRVGHHL